MAVDVARAVAARDAVVDVTPPRGVSVAPRDFAVRADVVTRCGVVWAVVRDGALPVRTAVCALNAHSAIIAAKIRVFFISDKILAKFGKSGQVK